MHDRDADPNRWGVSVCSTDGQRFDIGDVDDYFSIQSTSKVVTFAMALAEVGEKETLSYVGAVSPSIMLRPCHRCSAINCLPENFADTRGVVPIAARTLSTCPLNAPSVAQVWSPAAKLSMPLPACRTIGRTILASMSAQS